MATTNTKAAKAALAAASTDSALAAGQTQGANQNAEALAAAESAQSAAASGDAETAVDAVPAQASAPVAIGPDHAQNAEALATLLDGAAFPLKLRVTNRMPRPLVLPVLPGLSLGHVAGKKERTTCEVIAKSPEALHLAVMDVQAIAAMNQFTEGVTLQHCD